MAVYRKILLGFWDDTKVTDNFTPEDKYFFLYLLTNPHTSLCGCYEISYKTMSRETGYNEDTVKHLVSRFEEVHNVIRYSPATKEVLILNWNRYNWTKSEKLDKPLLEGIKKIKNPEFKSFLAEIYNGRESVEIPYAYGIDSVSIVYPYTIDTTVTVTDTNNIINSISFNSKNTNIDNFNYLLTLDEYKNLDIELIEVIRGWLDYKDHKKPKSSNHYDSERGLKALVNQIIGTSIKYGTSEVKRVIDESMGNNYQGIVWDKLNKTKSKPSGNGINAFAEYANSLGGGL